MELARRTAGAARADAVGCMHVVVLGLRGIVDVQGGIETHARMLYPLLARLGCRVEVIQRSPYFPKTARPAKWHGVTLRYLWCPTKPGVETALHTVLGLLYAAVVRPDVVHLHAIGPGCLAPLGRLLGLRIIVTHHAEDYRREKWGRLARFVLRRGESLGMRFAHESIVVSNVLREAMQKRYGVSANLIPNGAPRIQRAETCEALERFGIAAGLYVLCVARLDMTKRQIDLIDAFERAAVAHWKLVLVGSIDATDRYCASIVERAVRNSKIVLAGFQNGKALRELYSHCGMFVLPSSMEGHPIALLEALSYGVLVAASAIPENLALPIPRERFFRVGDTEELARLIGEATKGGDLVCEQTRRLVKDRYSWRRAAHLTHSVYKGASKRA